VGPEYSLDKDDVSGGRLLNVGVPQLDGVGARDSAIPQLVGGLLNFEFLEGPELGVPGEKGELAIDLVLEALL